MDKKQKSILAGIIGTVLEYYDFMLYMHFLFILSPLFFPMEDPFMSRLIGYVSFAIGYFVRPVSGVLFGHIGDKLGRKKALEIAILAMTLPTFIISFLPTYNVIGIFAPVILILCRICQSFSVSGEGVGASVFLIEHSSSKFRCRSSSLLVSANILGGIIGTLTGFIFTQPFMPDWGWRIPFFIGGIFGFLGYYIRNKLLFETQDYLTVKKEKKISRLPVRDIIRQNKINLLRAFVISASVLAPFRLTYVYMADILKNNIMLSTHEIMLHNTIVMTILLFAYLLMGWVSDKVGYKKVMVSSLILLLAVVYPMFEFVRETADPTKIMIMQIVISCSSAGIGAPACVYLTKLFPTQTRYSGVAFGWQPGTLFFAGLAPLIAALLVHWTGDPNAPAFFLIISAILGLLTLYKVKQYSVGSSFNPDNVHYDRKFSNKDNIILNKKKFA